MRIFLTGATGLLGGALAGALLDREHAVMALVRGEGRAVLDMDSRDRIAEVSLVAGDIAQPGFGMADPSQWSPDLLIHCAATTDFQAPAEVYGAINLGGTRHAIALAKQWGCPLLHVSTAYVCGRSDGSIAEAPVNLAGPFTNGYEASKAQSEALVDAAIAEGLIAAIIRPGIVLGRSSDGAIARCDDFYHLFRLFGSPLLGAVPALPHAGFAIVPIDYVTHAMVAMAEDMASFAGRRVHAVGARPFAMADMLRIVAEYPGATPARMVAPDVYDPAALDRRTAMIHRRVGPQFFDYFLRSPAFETRVLTDIAGLAAPEIDDAGFRRMIDFCIGAGFLDWR